MTQPTTAGTAADPAAAVGRVFQEVGDLHPFMHAGQYRYQVTGKPPQVVNGAGEVVSGANVVARSDHQFIIANAGRMLRPILALHGVPDDGMGQALSTEGRAEVHSIAKEAMAVGSGPSPAFLTENASRMLQLILALHMVPDDAMVAGLSAADMAEVHAIAQDALLAGIDIIGVSES